MIKMSIYVSTTWQKQILGLNILDSQDALEHQIQYRIIPNNHAPEMVHLDVFGCILSVLERVWTIKKSEFKKDETRF